MICPGFSSDCVETLEEIAIQGKESFLENGGENYASNDTVTDNFGNNYPIQVSNGMIVKVTPSANITTQINTVTVNDLPVLTVNSKTGVGAVLRPILDISNVNPAEFQGEVKKVIDCVT